MTADFAKIPGFFKDLSTYRTRLPHVNRIVYDITSKPPATVEWGVEYSFKKRLKSRFQRFYFPISNHLAPKL